MPWRTLSAPRTRLWSVLENPKASVRVFALAAARTKKRRVQLKIMSTRFLNLVFLFICVVNFFRVFPGMIVWKTDFVPGSRMISMPNPNAHEENGSNATELRWTRRNAVTTMAANGLSTVTLPKVLSPVMNVSGASTAQLRLRTQPSTPL